MGALTLYALKSAVVLAVLYLPYTLLLKRETFFALNRGVLLGIVVLSLVVPCLDIPVWHSDLSDRLASQSESLRAVTLPAVVVTAVEAQADAQLHQTDHSDLYLMYALVGLYMAGLVVCLAWKAFNLLRLVRFMSSGCLWTDKRDGMTIHCHAERVTPFSWMRNIVINEADDDRSPVLLHETAHVRLRHSWDTLLLSLAEVVQWFNPCIWMMDDALREVHEYEADDAVLRRGIPAESYQLLLIRKTVGEQRFAMANAFNHSLLKNRITMMNRKKSSKWASAKMLYIVPVTLACLNAFASATATEQEEKVTADPRPQLIVDSQSSGVDNDKQKHIETADIASVPVLKDKHAASAEHKTNNTIIITTKAADAPSAAPEDSTVYEVPEKIAEFPGGMEAAFVWLPNNLKYPQEALEWGVQGRLLVQFIVEKDGKISNARIIAIGKTSISDKDFVVYKAADDSPEELDKERQSKGRIALKEEALRVVNAMPNWKPARDKGKPVRSKFVLPITFRLS